jgi:beta-lactamase class A
MLLKIKNLSHKSLVRLIVVGTTLLGVGLMCGYYLNTLVKSQQSTTRRANDPEYSFINPLLSCDITENKQFPEYKKLKAAINTFIKGQDQTKITSVSVYYRDLNSGKWFSINENDLYSPASLLKVPVMMAYLKEAEQDDSLLSHSLVYTGTNAFSNSNEHYRFGHEIQPNNSYTVDQLMTSMIEYSDNAAADLLYRSIDQKTLEKVFSDIGIQLPDGTETSATADFLTVKSYSYLYRLLYNGTFLNRTMSEKALKLLAYTDFPKGITAGVPTKITVAQKFGERTIEDTTHQIESRELHDCGIVYYPLHPYIVCVMTKGADFDSLSSVIQTISKVIYNDVDQTYTDTN